MNPLMMLLQMMRGGGNPMQMMQKMFGDTPQVQQVMNIIGSKNPSQLRQTAENMYRERGLNINDVAKQFGLPLK